jgi:hypothetical protein
MKKFSTALLTLLLSISVTSCAVQETRTQTPIDPKHPWVVQLPQEVIQNHECTTIWICSLVNVTASASCEHLVFDFEIIDAASRETVVSGARSYWGYLPKGLTQVEFGFNNPILQSTAFSKPVASCLDSRPELTVLSSMQDFEPSFCKQDWVDACTSSSASGWELEDMYKLQFPIEIQKTILPSRSYTLPSDFSGSGYTVICEDGWISQSGGKQGACSSHGGVAD